MTSVQTLAASGDDVVASDLHAMKLNPVATPFVFVDRHEDRQDGAF
jgi:hypothetical protein